MKVNILFGILVILVLLLVALRVFFMPWSMAGYDHTDKYATFEGFAGSDTEVVICKASWCGHCQKAMPEFEKLVAASPIALPNGKKATVKMLDSDANGDELKQYDVKGFPTIIVKHGGDKMDYPGERTFDGVVEFLKSL